MKFSSLTERIDGAGAAGWDIHFAAAEAAAGGADVILLSVGDPDFSTPAPIVDVAVDALRSGDTHYVEMLGRPRLREIIARRFAERSGIEVGPDSVAVFSGTQNALFATSLCLFEPGDEVIVLDPMYVTYEACFQATGATLVPVAQPAESGFRPDVAAIAAAVTPSTRGIVIATPNNPTGVVMTSEELEGIADIARRHDLWVIADEVYGELVFDEAGSRREHVSIAGLDAMAERTITVSSVSKSHAMPGWRAGWAVAPPELIPHYGRLMLAMAYGLPGFIQEAAAAALESHDAESVEMCEIYRHRRDLAVEALAEASDLPLLVPEAGMFVMADVRAHAETSLDFGWSLYEAEGVAVLDAGAFGAAADGWVRISFTVGDAELAEGCRRIVRFINDRSQSR